MKFSHIKKHPVVYIVIFIVIILIGFQIFSPTDETSSYETMIVEKATLHQDVEGTGKVHPSEDRDLSFQRGGVVAGVYAEVGDEVKVGERLVVLDTSELQAQLRQAEALIEQEENTLAELERGSRPEELELIRAAVESAERSVEDAQSTYESVVAKAETDLTSAYDGAITTAASAVSSGKNALVVFSQIQYDRFISQSVVNPDMTAAKEIAVQKLFSENNAGGWSAHSISTLDSGVYGEILTITTAESDAVLDDTLSNALDALMAVSDALEAMPILHTFTTTEKTDLATQKTTVSSAVTSLSAKLQLVGVQKAANTSAIASAKASLTAAENALTSAQKELILKEAGSTLEALSTQQSRVASAYAQKDLITAQIGTMILTAPISGVVTAQEAERGVFMQPGQPVVSIISKGGFEVEVYVPEIDIAKVEVGDTVTITLDAYDDDDIFDATVSAIDPAETVLEGVSTYKVTILFTQEDDERIRSGMTADVIILTDTREDVLAVPTRAVMTEDGEKYVRVLVNGEMQNVPVTIGLRSSSGQTEIVEGLTGGEEVVTFIRK